MADALFSDEWRDRIAADPEAELARKHGNKRSNMEKYAKLAHATRLKKANPDFDFKSADPIDEATSSRRSSKRSKRRHAEVADEEEEDSQLQAPADQVNDQPQADEATLVNDNSQVDDFTEVNDHAQAPVQQGHDQEQQLAGAGQIDSQEQPPIVETNNYDQQIAYQDDHQAQDAMDPANNGDQQIVQQQQQQHYQYQHQNQHQNQQEHAIGQVYDQAQIPLEQANYQIPPNQLATMQQANSFNNQVPQVP